MAMNDDKIFLVRGVHPTENAAYVLANPLRNILLSKGFDCEIISIPFEYTIIGWARELGMGEIPKYPLCLNSYNWPELYGKEGHVFELHNEDFCSLKKMDEYPHVVVLVNDDLTYHNVELPAIFKQNGNVTIRRGLSILRKYLEKIYPTPDHMKISLKKYSSLVDMKSTERRGLLTREIVEHCANKIEDIIDLVEFEEVNSLGVE